MQAGTELAGRYILERVLGSGGMGDVWRGIDRELERPVAVKVMRDRLADPRRFQREARIAARLQHPGITVVHDVGTHDGQPFIVMELLHGSDLAAMLGQAPGRRLPVETAVSLIVQAASALQAAHVAHVIHRDLKPANLFRQDNGLLKICDFGIARIADAADGLTTAGSAIGTANYMSPEQCEGQSKIDGRSDLYSLGCVLYELLTGQPPFPRGTAREIMNQHMNAPPASLRTVRPEVPGELDTVVLAMLAKDPGDRPDDAGRLAAALMAVSRRGASAAGQSVLPEAATSAGPALAADGESTVTSDRPRPRRTRKDPRAAATQRDRILVTGPPPPADLQPQLQVAPSTGSWSLLAFDPLGRWLASADGDGTLTLWDVASGLPVRSWSAGAHVLAMAAGPGDRLAVGGDDGCARIWDVAHATLGDQFRGHAGGVQAVALDQKGARLATGDADGVVRLWDPGSRQPVTARRSAYGAVTALAFDASGGRLAAGGEDDTLRVWDVGSPHAAILLAERPYGKEVTAIAFGPAGQLAIGGADGQVRVWDLGSPESRGRPAGQDHDGGVLALAWDAGERLWVSVGTDGRLRAGGAEQQLLVGVRSRPCRDREPRHRLGRGDRRPQRVHPYLPARRSGRAARSPGIRHQPKRCRFRPVHRIARYRRHRWRPARLGRAAADPAVRRRPGPRHQRRGRRTGRAAGGGMRGGWQLDRLRYRRWVRRPEQSMGSPVRRTRVCRGVQPGRIPCGNRGRCREGMANRGRGGRRCAAGERAPYQGTRI